MKKFGTLFSRSALALRLEDGNIADFFIHSEAAEFIGEQTVRLANSIDIPATATKLGVEVSTVRMLWDGLYITRHAFGNLTGKPAIQLKEGLEESVRQFTFGHEVGHHFLDDVLHMPFAGTEHNDIMEAFCDFFGQEMVAPGQVPYALTEAKSRETYLIPDDYRAYIASLYTQNQAELDIGFEQDNYWGEL